MSLTTADCKSWLTNDEATALIWNPTRALGECLYRLWNALADPIFIPLCLCDTPYVYWKLQVSLTSFKAHCVTMHGGKDQSLLQVFTFYGYEGRIFMSWSKPWIFFWRTMSFDPESGSKGLRRASTFCEIEGVACRCLVCVEHRRAKK